MKNLLFLIITVFGFSLFYSCGEENFEPYDVNNYNSYNLKLLPSEITKSYKDPGTGSISTTQIILDYNSKNQLISIQETLTGGYKKTYDITYNATDNVAEVSENSANSTVTTYTYEYVDAYTIKEHISTTGAAAQTHTLTLNPKKQLTSKQGSDIGLITYSYDTMGDLISENSSSYPYDNTKGWMSSVKTPHWLFYSFGENFPGTYNLINNVTQMGINAYNYVEFNSAKYPVRVTINNNTELTIKYTCVK